METNKIQGQAKSLILDNGAEITYCERGENNSEVVITGAFYFHTFMPVVEGLAKKFHVYGVVMRFDGITDQKTSDGSTHWGRQWGKDIHDFAEKLGVKKFHYVGKCHGTVPGWYIFKNYPEMLNKFCSFFLAPHLKPQNSENWYKLLTGNDSTKMMKVALRYPETGLPKKMAEMKALGGNVSSPAIPEYASSPEKVWDNLADCENDLKNTKIPVKYLFGSEDPLLEDYYDSNMYAWKITKDCKFVILNGERHLMELDSPEKVVEEVLNFI